MTDNCLKVVLVFIVLAFVGCASERIASDIDQKQANEIVAVLNDKGIVAYARQSSNAQGRYAVEVDRSDYSIAISILHELGLPRESSPSFYQITQQKGFIPNSREVEAARLDYALSLEIEEKLKSIAGVESVKAVVRSNIIKDQQTPSASVIVQIKPGTQLNAESVAEIVKLMVPGLSQERTLVWIRDVEIKDVAISDKGVSRVIGGAIVHRPLVPFLKIFEVPQGDSKLLATAFIGCMCLAGFLCFLVGYAFGGRSQPSSRASAALPGVARGKSNADRVSGKVRLDATRGQKGSKLIGE